MRATSALHADAAIPAPGVADGARTSGRSRRQAFRIAALPSSGVHRNDADEGPVRIRLWVSGDDPGLGPTTARREQCRDREQAGIQSVGRFPQNRCKGFGSSSISMVPRATWPAEMNRAAVRMPLDRSSDASVLAASVAPSACAMSSEITTEWLPARASRWSATTLAIAVSKAAAGRRQAEGSAPPEARRLEMKWRWRRPCRVVCVGVSRSPVSSRNKPLSGEELALDAPRSAPRRRVLADRSCACTLFQISSSRIAGCLPGNVLSLWRISPR